MQSSTDAQVCSSHPAIRPCWLGQSSIWRAGEASGADLVSRAMRVRELFDGHRSVALLVDAFYAI
jgi:hypothetical protein